MRALADRAVIDSTAAGTEVRLQWDNIAQNCGSRTDLNEELVDLAHRAHELVEVHRLGDVGVGVQLVAAQDVLFGRRGGQHHDRDEAQIGVGLDLLQQLPAVVLGQVEVQQDQIGPRGVGEGRPRRYRKSSPSSPSWATCRLFLILLCSNASRVISSSPGSSSTSRMSMARLSSG